MARYKALDMAGEHADKKVRVLKETTEQRRCPWCGVDTAELTGRCYCGREPPHPAPFHVNR